MSRVDISGKRFGRLTALIPDETRHHGRTTWLCQCDCGSQKVTATKELCRGDSQSCGCLKKEVLSARSVLNLKGQKFGKLTVLERQGSSSDRKANWLCQCDCGNASTVSSVKLTSGHTKSCGCLNLERITKHGMSRSRTYAIWNCMRGRCTNPNNYRWKDYGGRGITIDPQWEDFSVFLADMGEAPDGMTLERKDTNQGYCKTNCKWATWHDQFRNRRNNVFLTLNGETKIISDWAKDLGASYHTIQARLHRGWSLEDALTKPVNNKSRNRLALS